MQTILKKLEILEKLFIGEKKILTLEEFAQYAGLSRSYVYKLTSSGKIPFYKPNGKNIYFNRVEVEKWLLRNRSKSLEEIEEAAANHSSDNKNRGKHGK